MRPTTTRSRVKRRRIRSCIDAAWRTSRQTCAIQNSVPRSSPGQWAFRCGICIACSAAPAIAFANPYVSAGSSGAEVTCWITGNGTSASPKLPSVTDLSVRATLPSHSRLSLGSPPVVCERRCRGSTPRPNSAGGRHPPQAEGGLLRYARRNEVLRNLFYPPPHEVRGGGPPEGWLRRHAAAELAVSPSPLPPPCCAQLSSLRAKRSNPVAAPPGLLRRFRSSQ